jgi:phenylalanyl-tRNA synthetase beta chain
VLSCGMLCSLRELGLTVHDYPYGEIKAAALLNDYKALDKAKPSIPAGAAAGYKIFGSVAAAKVLEVISGKDGMFDIALDLGGSRLSVSTDCQNIHAGDMVACDTAKKKICTLEDLHAKQEEFPHCIADGIFVLRENCRPGDDIRKVLGFDDTVIEYEITPNRPDCLSMIGLAREAAATFGRELRLHTPEIKGCGGNITDFADVEIADAELCPRYTARLVKNVRIAPSPEWMRERLRASGVRPINNIVDITNYVMLEYGQPMHAFDFSCVEGGKIIVRRARAGESIKTLDGNDRALTENMLCICDEKKPVCVAGVMGGANSEIIGDTAMVLFESANFNGTSIRRTATALGMRTEASGRYEKGLDPVNTMKAVQRACELVEKLGAGDVVDGFIDVIASDIPENVIKLRPARVNALLGTDVAESDMRRILEKLDFVLDGDDIHVPSWRGDVEGIADIAEEVARFTGYDNIPSTLMSGSTLRGGLTDAQKAERLAGIACRDCGYDEMISYSFISPSAYDKIRLPKDSPLRKSVTILNPLGEDTSVMRTTTLPCMLDVLTRNFNYRNKSVKLYEISKIYQPRADGLADEPKRLSMGAYGDDMDFFALKGAVEAILSVMNLGKISYSAVTDNPSFHPGRCAALRCGDTYLGVIGEIHPLVCANYGVDVPLYAAELDFGAMLACRGGIRTYVPLPKFPAVTRDIAVTCDASITVAQLEDCIARGARGLLREVTLFDIYTGLPIPAGMKSVAFNLQLRADDRNLTAAEADEDVQSILALLRSELGATLR